MLVKLTDVAYLSFATSTISLTITRAKVSKPARAWISARSKFFGELFSCPYCTAHWVAFVLCAFYGDHRPTIDWFVSSMAVVSLASIISGVVFSQISKIRKED